MQKAKNTAMLSVGLALIILMLIYSSTILDSAKKAIESAVFSVVPVLLPYCFLASIIGEQFYSLPNGVAVFAVFLLGNICGNPIGALLTERLYESGALDKNNASVLLAVSSSVSPAFSICVIGTMLSSATLGLVIYLTNFSLNFLLLLLLFKHRGGVSKSGIPTSAPQLSFTEILVRATKKSAVNMSALVVCMVFFSSLCSLISGFFHLNNNYRALISSFLEIGSTVLNCYFIEKSVALPIAAFSSAFFGFSIFIQIFANVKELKKSTFLLIRLSASLILLLLFLHISSIIY